MIINTIKVVDFQSIEMVNDWIALNPGWEPFQLIKTERVLPFRFVPDTDDPFMLQVVFRYKG